MGIRDRFVTWFGPYPFNAGAPVDQKKVIEETGEDPAYETLAQSRVPDDVLSAIARRKLQAEVTALRITTPGVSVTPIPQRTKIVYANSVNYVADVRVPEDCELMQFFAPSGVVFYVSFNGRVALPISANSDDLSFNDFLVSPLGAWFYCRGKNSVSIGIPFNGQVVSVGFV